jgi:hypothetical protein
MFHISIIYIYISRISLVIYLFSISKSSLYWDEIVRDDRCNHGLKCKVRAELFQKKIKCITNIYNVIMYNEGFIISSKY